MGRREMPRLRLSQLRLDFQPQENLIEEIVQERMQDIATGAVVEPVTVRFDGESYFLQDGFHRVEATRRCGLSDIEAEILPGTLEDMEADFQDMLRALKASL